MLGFTRSYIEKNGGKVVGDEYLPMDGSDWTPIYRKLKEAKPDAIITSTAGGAPNVTLTKQMRAAGVEAALRQSRGRRGHGQEHGRGREGIYLSASYVTNIDTPENKKFLGRDARSSAPI